MSISRPLLGGTIMGAVLVVLGRPPLSHLIFLAAGISILMSVEGRRPGYLHSVPSVVSMSLLALGLSPLLCGDFMCGMAVAAGMASGLLTDYMNGSVYIWKKDGEWISAMPDKRWAKHGDAAISLVCGIILVVMVVMG